SYQALAFAIAGSLFVVPALLGWSPAIRKNMIKASLILVNVSVILLGGYTFLNHVKFGYLGLTPMLPIALSSRTSQVIERLPDEYATVREVLIRARDADLIARGGPHTGY